MKQRVLRRTQGRSRNGLVTFSDTTSRSDSLWRAPVHGFGLLHVGAHQVSAAPGGEPGRALEGNVASLETSWYLRLLQDLHLLRT